MLTTVPGRSAAWDVRVASSIAAAARGDAAQAAFDRKLSDYRKEIVELRQQGIQDLSLVWTADGRPHPAVTRTLQYAADTASSRNGQQMSARSLRRRWKREIQIALPTPESSHGTSSSAKFIGTGQNGSSLVSLMEPCISGGMSSLLTVDPATTTKPTPRLTQQYQTMTTTSPLSPAARSSLCSHQVSNRWVHAHLGWFVSGWRWLFRMSSQMSLSCVTLRP